MQYDKFPMQTAESADITNKSQLRLLTGFYFHNWILKISKENLQMSKVKHTHTHTPPHHTTYVCVCVYNRLDAAEEYICIYVCAKWQINIEYQKCCTKTKRRKHEKEIARHGGLS